MREQQQKLDVLVVDDERDVREGSARVLSRGAFEVRTAETGEDGLKQIEARAPDLLLLDLMMPGIGGLEVLERLQQTHPDLLVIVITGYATIETAVEAMKKGAYDFLPKPFTPDQLRIVVGRAAERRRLEEERRRTLNDLHGERSRTKTILNALATGILVTNAAGNVTLSNPAVLRLLGLDAPLEPGTPLADWISDPALLEQVKRVSEAVPEEGRLSLEIRRDDGSWLRARSSPVLDENEAIAGVVTVFANVTDLKLLDELKSEFVAKVSHELRSPLSSIDQQMAVVLGDLVDGVTDEQRARLSRVQGRTRGLIQLVSDMLDLSRIESGLAGGEQQAVDVAEMLRSVTEMLTVQAETKNQVLTLELPEPPLPPMSAEPTSLESVFTNLVTNAITYTPEQGSITISAATAEGGIAVSVKDSGIGIEERHLPHLFDRFYRVKNEKTRYTVGTGLGLAIVKRIVEALGGRIDVRSEVGAGTTFTVYLPTGAA